MPNNQKLVDNEPFVLSDGRSFRITSAEVRKAKADYDSDDDVQCLKEIILRAGVSKKFARETVRMIMSLYS